MVRIKGKITGKTGNNDKKFWNNGSIKISESVFWITLEKKPLINCEVEADLNWSKKCVRVTTVVAYHCTTFSITDTKLYVPVVTLSTQHNAKLL